MDAMGAFVKVVADLAIVGDVWANVLSSTSVGYYIKIEARVFE